MACDGLGTGGFSLAVGLRVCAKRQGLATTRKYDVDNSCLDRQDGI